MRLLNKTITAYFIYSAILMMVAIPVFYFALKKILISSVDESLVSTKTTVIPLLQTDIQNHRESRSAFSSYEIQYEKDQPNNREDSLFTIESTGPDPKSFYSNRQLLSHFYVNQEFYSLHITSSLTDKFVLLKRIAWVTSLLLIFLSLGLLLMNRLMAAKTWKPFYTTLNKLKAYRVEQQPVLKLEQTTINEFNDLNQAVEMLTKTNYQTYLSQKEFTENASHEMQSPLAVFQSKLELLMQTGPLNEEQASLIADLANASKRMFRLNKTLILLTKIDNDQFLEKEKISVNEIIEKLISQFAFQIDKESIRISVEKEADILLEANKTLIDIMLGNLLSNAIRHNVQNGFIRIILREKELQIQNSGKPIALDDKKLFRRFQKDSPDAESLGLGLEIVKKICTLNRYRIEYRFNNLTHIFTVVF
jgi:signal transduction histidine kinase